MTECVKIAMGGRQDTSDKYL